MQNLYILVDFYLDNSFINNDSKIEVNHKIDNHFYMSALAFIYLFAIIKA